MLPDAAAGAGAAAPGEGDAAAPAAGNRFMPHAACGCAPAVGEARYPAPCWYWRGAWTRPAMGFELGFSKVLAVLIADKPLLKVSPLALMFLISPGTLPAAKPFT